MMSWPADPESLLAGPRGRRLCWALVPDVGGSGQVRDYPAWQQVLSYSLAADPADLASELAAAVDQTDWAAFMADMSDLDLVEPLAESVTSAMFWQEPDLEDQALAHPEVADTLRPVAQAVTGAPAARWWSGGLDPAAQQYVESLLGKGEGPPLSGASSRLAGWRAAADEEERSAAERPADPAAPYSGHWWSSPAWAELANTTRVLAGLGPLQLFAMEELARVGRSALLAGGARPPGQNPRDHRAGRLGRPGGPLPARGHQVPATRLVAGHRLGRPLADARLRRRCRRL
jgi:hypothetical protein